jgi:HSP20 family protein
MAEDLVASPDVCIFGDDNQKSLNIQIELPGVNKKDIELRLFEDGFYVAAKKEGIKYMGSFALISPVKPDKAIAEYEDGLLLVNVPYKEPLREGIRVMID